MRFKGKRDIQTANLHNFSKELNFLNSLRKITPGLLNYIRSVLYPLPQSSYRAIAFEGLGRCLLSSEKYDEADKVYNELSKNYGQFQNKAGHPYGIIAAFQLYEIAKEKKEEENYLRILLDLYKKIREGIWLINQPVYDFYIEEIESILNKKLIEGKFPEIQKSYIDIQKLQSPYRQALTFTDLLERKIYSGNKGKTIPIPGGR